MTTDDLLWSTVLLRARRSPVAGKLLHELRRRGATIEHDRQGLLLRCDAVVPSPMLWAGATAVLAVLSEASE